MYHHGERFTFTFDILAKCYWRPSKRWITEAVLSTYLLRVYLKGNARTFEMFYYIMTLFYIFKNIQ